MTLDYAKAAARVEDVTGPPRGHSRIVIAPRQIESSQGMWRGQHSRTAVIGAALAAFTVCSVLPIAYLLATTLGRPSGALQAVVLDERQRGLLYNTALLGTGTAVLATAIGASLGIMLARVPVRGKGTIRLLATVPVLLPPYVLALGGCIWGAVEAFSPLSPAGTFSRNGRTAYRQRSSS